MGIPLFSTQLAAPVPPSAPRNDSEPIAYSDLRLTRSLQMTHYGPSPLPQHDPTIVGITGSAKNITLWMQTTREPPLTLKKEMSYDEAVELARCLINEAAALLKRGM